MATSEAQKRANAKWNASKDNIMVRVDVADGASIRAAAAAESQSVTQYMLQAAKERMNRDNDISVESSDSLDYEAINEHVQKTGETASEFIVRAVNETIEREEKIFW